MSVEMPNKLARTQSQLETLWSTWGGKSLEWVLEIKHLEMLKLELPEVPSSSAPRTEVRIWEKTV
jgi:hypothetical protein